MPDLLFEMHPCGLHVCYPKKLGQFGFVQTVQDNMKLFSKRQIAGAIKARELYEKLIYPSTADFRAIVAAGGVPGSDVTIDDVKATEVIWGRSVIKLKGNTVRREGKRKKQSIITLDEILEANYVGNCLLGEPDLILIAWYSALLGDLQTPPIAGHDERVASPEDLGREPLVTTKVKRRLIVQQKDISKVKILTLL